jgi:hypothetical protein
MRTASLEVRSFSPSMRHKIPGARTLVVQYMPLTVQARRFPHHLTSLQHGVTPFRYYRTPETRAARRSGALRKRFQTDSEGLNFQ